MDERHAREVTRDHRCECLDCEEAYALLDKLESLALRALAAEVRALEKLAARPLLDDDGHIRQTPRMLPPQYRP